MKHLKYFEYTHISNPPKFKIGDYVSINMQPDYNYDECLAQIVDITNKEDYPYVIQFYNDTTFSMGEDGLTLLTPEEIEYFKILKTSSKYNL